MEVKILVEWCLNSKHDLNLSINKIQDILN
jgi:hypothetical protein